MIGAIVITFELRSSRGALYDKHLGEMRISNDGMIQDGTRGNYNIILSRKGGRTRFAKVFDFPRHSRSVFELTRRALQAIHLKKDLP